MPWGDVLSCLSDMVLSAVNKKLHRKSSYGTASEDEFSLLGDLFFGDRLRLR